MNHGREWARTVRCIDERSSLRVLSLVHESTDRLLAVLHANAHLHHRLRGLRQLPHADLDDPVLQRSAPQRTDVEGCFVIIGHREDRERPDTDATRFR